MRKYNCPFCEEFSCKYVNETMYGENDLRYFFFKCNVCSMEFLVEERMAQDTGAINRSCAYIPDAKDRAGIPDDVVPNAAINRKKGEAMEKAYIISAECDEINTVQDMLFAAGYTWTGGSVKYLSIEENQLFFTIYPNGKNFAQGFSIHPEHRNRPRIDLVGLANIISGIVPKIESVIRIDGQPVKFYEDGSIMVGCAHINRKKIKDIYDISYAKYRLNENWPKKTK